MVKRRKVWVLILTVLAVYVGLSALLGSPLGFGRIMERTAAKEYCSIVYPQAPLGKTVYNPIASGYQTAVYLDGSDGDSNSIGVNLAERTIYDPSREASFLEESGVGECIEKLERKYGNCYIACRVVWPCSDPSAPVLRLWLDYTDSESTPLPDEAQIKELLSPIVLDCILQVEEHYPLDKATIKYYHPDFDPHEHGMTWRTLEISLAPDVPRTETLLDPAGFTVN